jgi:excisionase family DNA binding protein
MGKVNEEIMEKENELRRQIPEPFLSVKELALWLGMSEPWVYKAAEKNLIPFVRIGEAIRFNPSQIKQYLNQRSGIKRIYGESRNPKVRKKKVFLVRDQEAKNNGS